ncbi:MAG: MarR family winged helix-turn-helix transcriptional regulator [Burkholderiales bacterium]|jgi:MarR family transcriptional repressor of emrRAB|nr:MarR family transcriptional regulator [Nitrosomonadaceae bacterium]
MDKNPLVLLELVTRLGNLMRAEARRVGSEHQLSPVHVEALVYLANANRYSNTPQALVEYLGLTKGTVSQSLLLLDRRGLIERYQDDLDRRVVRLRLSGSGEQFLYDAQPQLMWLHATRDISPNRIRNAVSALREALNTMQGDAERAPFGTCPTCRHFERLSARAYRCGLMGDRLSGPDTRKICWLHELKGGAVDDDEEL